MEKKKHIPIGVIVDKKPSEVANIRYISDEEIYEIAYKVNPLFTTLFKGTIINNVRKELGIMRSETYEELDNNFCVVKLGQDAVDEAVYKHKKEDLPKVVSEEIESLMLLENKEEKKEV